MSEVGHLHADPAHKKVALLIAILALILALAETLAKGAQTTALSANIEAANLWSFFQAKTMRMTRSPAVSGMAAVVMVRHVCQPPVSGTTTGPERSMPSTSTWKVAPVPTFATRASNV